MQGGDERKTWELLVTINCCDGCRKKVKQKLLGIKGVCDVTLHPEINLVSVTGSVHPDALLKGLNKLNKRAKLKERHVEDSEIISIPQEPVTKDNEDPKDGALGKVANGLKPTVGYDGWNRHESTDNISPKKSRSANIITSQSERIGLELNLMGVGGKISYRKDVSFKT